jgi:hypothetical protein
MPMCRVILIGLALTAVMANGATHVSADAETDAPRVPVETVRPVPDEYIVLEADSLRPDEVVVFRQLEPTQVSRERYALANGTSLRPGRHTRAGSYLLEDGQLLQVYAPNGEPRQFALQARPARGLWFRTVTARCAGVFVDVISDSSGRAEDELLRDYFHRSRPWLGGLRIPQDVPAHWVAEIYKDWFPHGFLKLPDRRQGLARITWIAFDAVDRPGAIVIAERRIVAGADGEGPLSPSPGPPGPKETRNARVLGRVLVDLASGRVVQREGAIH